MRPSGNETQGEVKDKLEDENAGRSDPAAFFDRESAERRSDIEIVARTLAE
jgi:hypothetical protein